MFESDRVRACVFNIDVIVTYGARGEDESAELDSVASLKLGDEFFFVHVHFKV